MKRLEKTSSILDGRGILCRVDCSHTGYFEEYGFHRVKDRIVKLFDNLPAK